MRSLVESPTEKFIGRREGARCVVVGNIWLGQKALEISSYIHVCFIMRVDDVGDFFVLRQLEEAIKCLIPLLLPN